MKIDDKTLWTFFEPLYKRLSDEERKRVAAEAAAAFFGKGGYYDMTLGDFVTLIGGNAQGVFPNYGKQLCTVFEWLSADGLKDFAKQYAETLEKFVPPTDADEQNAQNVCYKMTTAEGLLIFARDYFGLKSFAQAAEITLGDLLIAKKDAYNKIVYQRRLAAIKSKKK